MDTRTKGMIGEDVVSKSLEGEGYSIITRNYLKKWGEIDIIAKKDKVLHFVEVKSVTGVPEGRTHSPEENVHDLKLRKIRRMIQTYLVEKNLSHETEFQFHVACVYMNMQTRKARIKWIKNVIL